MKPAYAIVMPARKMTRKAQGFDYIIPPVLRSELRIGDFVDIPFRSRILLGVVLELNAKTTQPPDRLKAILRIRTDSPRFPKPYLQWLQWFSAYYGVSLSHALHRSLAEAPKRQRSPMQSPRKLEGVPIRLSKIRAQEILNATKKIRTEKPHLLQWWNRNERDATYFFLCQRVAGASKQILLIFSTQEEAQRFVTRLPASLQKKTTLIADGGKQSRFKQWQAVAQGQKNIICGTRRALWFPFPLLGMVIVDEEQHEYHKQADQNPRYHARTAALALAEAYGIPALLSSIHPSLEARTLVLESQRIILRHPQNVHVTLVSRLEEIRKGNYELISEKLEEIIQITIQRKQNVFLFHNRTGLFHQLQCRTCESAVECPTCRVPLFLTAAEDPRCPRCQKPQRPVTACSACGGVTFSKRRKGLIGLKHDVKKNLPQTPVVILDRVRSQIQTSVPTVFLGPTSLIPLLKEIPAMGMAGVIHAEQLLQSFNFRSGERMVQTMIALQSVCDSAGIRECVIQSNAPDHPLIQTILDHDFDTFMNVN